MKIAYILFDGITTLEYLGISDHISSLKSLKFIPNLARDPQSSGYSVQDNFGREIYSPGMSPDFSNYNPVIIPGGFGTRKLQYDVKFLNWIKTTNELACKISIPTGSLLLGAAGMSKASSYATYFNKHEKLAPYV